MGRVLPQVLEVSGRHSQKTIFTRFMPPRSAGDCSGTWKAYYEKWWMMTGEHLPGELMNLVPELQELVPPALLFDKTVYSPWLDGRLHSALRKDGVDHLVFSGGETDVCVMAAVLGAIDLGYRITLLDDAVCSGADETHDASLEVLRSRFSVQLEAMSTEEFLSRAC